MTRERIEDIREVVLPFVKHVLLKINYENLGESDAQEFTRDFNEFLDMAIKALEQEPRWIPVSEKLPEKEGDYLLWGKVCEDEEEYQFIGSYDSGCEQFGIWQEQFDRTTLGCLGSEFFEYASVVAWMPLPKPYKLEMESEE